MAVREDWTRITHSLHSFISTFRSHDRHSSRTECANIMKPPKVQSPAIMVRTTVNPRLVAEIERRRSPAYMSSLRNQIR